MDKQNVLYYSQRPIKLLSNRVWRTYHGGMKLEEWQGKCDTKDGEFPEEWVASLIKAQNPGREFVDNEGLSCIETEEGGRLTLKQLIDLIPEDLLGKSHVKKIGDNTGVLVKILDSAERLTIQVHPDKKTAKRLFASIYGKTEAWYVLGGRKIGSEPPYVLIGFKKGLTREKWEQLFRKQDIGGMLEALHKFYIEPGQVFLIEGGVPHAIGSGCFLIEIQEPTDYTLRVERKTPAGRNIPDTLCHQGLGFENMLDCFNYNTYTYQEMLDHWCIKPEVTFKNRQDRETVLVGYKNTPCFALNLLEIHTSRKFTEGDTFSIIVINSGNGLLRWENGCMDIRQGEQFFLPAGVGKLECINKGSSKLNLLRCFPPETFTKSGE